MEWTFIYLMLVLKIPIALLFWIVWWAVHNVDDETAVPEGDERDDDGGIGRVDHPRSPKPRPTRRGPHPGPVPPAPARSRRTPSERTRAGQDR